MSMKAHVVPLSVTLLLVFAGCTTNSDSRARGHASAPSEPSSTFAILPVAVNPTLPPATATAVANAAENGTRNKLRGLGYTETGITNTDLVFYVHGKSMRPVDLTPLGYQPDPERFGFKPAQMSALADRRLFVEAYDNQTKQQIWLGSLECGCRGVQPERIQREIERIVAMFPPRAGS